jgi:hypothetical protein
MQPVVFTALPAGRGCRWPVCPSLVRQSSWAHPLQKCFYCYFFVRFLNRYIFINISMVNIFPGHDQAARLSIEVGNEKRVADQQDNIS